MIDRSISSLRTLRPETDFDKSIFWFRDDLHQPYAISPMGMSTIQAHHAWGYHVAAEETKLPPSKGGHVKIYKGRVYIGFALIDDPAEIGKREPHFGKLVEYCVDNWKDYYQKYIKEVISNLDTLNGVDTDKLIFPHLLEHLRRAERLNRRNWEIHFILMYPADAVYFMFEDYCKKHDLEEKDLVIMLRGFESIATQTDEELWNLALFADKCGIKNLLVDTPSDQVLEKFRKTPEARAWLDKFNKFLSIYGNRVVAAHLDITTPTWKEDPIPVLDTIKGYYARIDSGWDFYKAKDEIKVQRENAIKDFESKLKDKEEKVQFRKMLKAAQGVYAFQEDHGFYIDQGSTAALRNAIIACGKRLFRRNLIESIEDVAYLTFHELVEIMEALVYNEEITKYHYGALVPNLVRERKEDARLSADADAPLTFGNIPEKMTDPIGIKVFGIIDDILHPKGEKEVEERLEGFPGAPGVVEGPARVIMDYKDFQKVKAGEILVCPYTGTAWTPLFIKIGGVVTDTGGMLTHAAIAAREYGIPAVVGTWNATNSINDGDTIKIDGNVGIVEVINRAKTA
jgi:pyruvate,water dikinase